MHVIWKKCFSPSPEGKCRKIVHEIYAFATKYHNIEVNSSSLEFSTICSVHSGVLSPLEDYHE